MADRNPRDPNAPRKPAQQQGEEHGSLKHRQQTEATMRERDLPRGSEPETHARK